MSVRIHYFAGLREALGLGGEEIELPASVATVGALQDWLAGQGRDALATAKNLRCAVNQQMAGFGVAVKSGDEVAFFPPVTGG